MARRSLRNSSFLANDKIRQLLQDDSEEEVGGEESDDEELVITTSDHDSSSELEGSDEEDPLAEIYTENHSDFFIGKDKNTKWSKISNICDFERTGGDDFEPGPTTSTTINELESFQIIFTNDIIDDIVRHTNAYVLSIQLQYARERDAKFVTKCEMMAFIGLLILSSVKKVNHTHFLELWTADGTGMDIFRACMSYKRFLIILRVIRFDDKFTRDERKQTDKLAAIRHLLDAFVRNCKSAYCLGEFITIDEMLVAFRGRCCFIQYMPKKPAKYGVKIFILCDSKTYFVGNIEVYCGLHPEGPYLKSNATKDLTLRLLDHITGSKRTLTCDNWFVSYELAQSLLEQKIALVGTLKKNKVQIPNEFLPNKSRTIGSSLFGFQKQISITSYVPKKNKSVILLSSMHDNNLVNSDTNKPEVIHFYNSNKGGVDTVDQLCSGYSVSRRTRRWPLCIFFQLLNIGGVNAQILYNSVQENTKKPRRIFLKNLAFALMKAHLTERYQSTHTKSHIKIILAQFVTQSTVNESNTHPTSSIISQAVTDTEPPKKRGRCESCPKNNYTTMKCTRCRNFTCKEHSTHITTCNTCLSSQ